MPLEQIVWVYMYGVVQAFWQRFRNGVLVCKLLCWMLTRRALVKYQSLHLLLVNHQSHQKSRNDSFDWRTLKILRYDKLETAQIQNACMIQVMGKETLLCTWCWKSFQYKSKRLHVWFQELHSIVSYPVGESVDLAAFQKAIPSNYIQVDPNDGTK